MVIVFGLIMVAAIACFFIALVWPRAFNRPFRGKANRLNTALTFAAITLLSSFVVASQPSPAATNKTAVPSPSSTPSASELAKPVATATPISDQDVLKRGVTDGLASDHGTFRAINVVPQDSGGIGAFVEINAPKNLPPSFTKTMVEYGMEDAYLALHKSGKDVTAMSVAAYLPLTDKYGNTSDVMVYKTLLRKDQADKINWSDDDTARNAIGHVWDVTILMPYLQQ